MYGNLTDEELGWGRDLLSKIDFLRLVPKEELENISKSLEKHKYSAKKVIILQGEIIYNLFLVHSGKVSVWMKPQKQGEKKKIAEISPNGYFGEMSLIGTPNARATVVADEETVVYTISGENFLNIIQNDMEALKTIRDVIMDRQKKMDKEKESSKS